MAECVPSGAVIDLWVLWLYAKDGHVESDTGFDVRDAFINRGKEVSSMLLMK